MLRRALRASLIALGTTSRSVRIRIKSAAPGATSVPEMIARPRLARASAGAVVDPVPDHGYRAPLGLQVLDHGGLVVRQHLGDADLGSDRPGGGLVVAGEQHRAQSEPVQFGDRRG
jgi:hypothetical protein